MNETQQPNTLSTAQQLAIAHSVEELGWEALFFHLRKTVELINELRKLSLEHREFAKGEILASTPRKPVGRPKGSKNKPKPVATAAPEKGVGRGRQ